MSFNPTLGRFLQMDSDGYVDGPNRYQFAQSRPTVGLDPTGDAVVLVGQGQYGAITFPEIAGFGFAGAADQELAVGVDGSGVSVGTYESVGGGPVWGVGGGGGVGPEFAIYPGTSDPSDLAGWGYSIFGAGFNQDLFIDPPYGQPGGLAYGLPIGPGELIGYQGGVEISYSWVQILYSGSWSDVTRDLIGGALTCPDDGIVPLSPFEQDIPSFGDDNPLPKLPAEMPTVPGGLEAPSTNDPSMLPKLNMPEFSLPSVPDIHLPTIPLIGELRDLRDAARGIIRAY